MEWIRKIRYHSPMMFHNFSKLLVLSLLSIPAGCNCLTEHCSLSSPLAQSTQTVAPPATFSSQESYLGQTPGNYVPKPPATTFQQTIPSAATPTPPPPMQLPEQGERAGTLPVIQQSPIQPQPQQGATLFSSTTANNSVVATTQSDWSAAHVQSTDQTAFQAMQSKLKSEPQIEATSYAVTKISEE